MVVDPAVVLRLETLNDIEFSRGGSSAARSHMSHTSGNGRSGNTGVWIDARFAYSCLAMLAINV